MNMERLRQADLRSVSISSESEQLSTGRVTRGPKTQDCSHIAFGSKVTGRPPLTARKGSSLANGTEHKAHSGRSGRLKTQPPAEQASSERTGSGGPKQVLNGRKEKIATHFSGHFFWFFLFSLSPPPWLLFPFPDLSLHPGFALSQLRPLLLHIHPPNLPQSSPEGLSWCVWHRPAVSHHALQNCGADSNTADLSKAGLYGDMRTSINRTSVREIPPEDVKLHKVRESMRRMPVGSSTCDLSKKAEQEEDEEEELRMLASLKRQQEEEEGGTCDSGLSASQVQQCNVSLSMSSDDTSTWTQCIPLVSCHLHMNTGMSSGASEQGQYYQKEMNPLLHSNPREWMDVLSPPIIHPRQQQTESKGDHSNKSTKALLVPYPGCCPRKVCPADHFPFFVRSGAANAVGPKICFDNRIIISGGQNNVGWGINIVIVDGETGNILRSDFFELYSEGLLNILKTIRKGNIVLVASYADPAIQLTDEVRELFADMGSSMVYSVKYRDSWVFAGAGGLNKESPFEKLIVNDQKTNAYGDWPEMAELGGCFPRKV
ncbi:hypothetical protein QTP70_022352 [Hemibagrus guttatus]|uniref:ILEI/PANDER domain-containing protein n=1 Tax=Hemibagrus guttatus TaxID=175788 RepID=A0AAE0VE93_9TELE|nr:hypothetical protein QTP70_022352 [Hemibagrus guttatus]